MGNQVTIHEINTSSIIASFGAFALKAQAHPWLTVLLHEFEMIAGVEAAFQIIVSDPSVKAILVNIFGGITRGDEVAQGINDALDNFETLPKPIVVRLDGTNAKEGMEILNTDHLTVESTLESAVQRVIKLASQGGT